MTRAARSGAFELGHSGRVAAEPEPPPLAALSTLARLDVLRKRRLYGQGVAVAVVDDGIYRESVQIKLRAATLMDHGACPLFDVEHSRVMGSVEPFSRTRRSHGSMCAYDACLAAPGCTLLDFAILAPRPVGFRRLGDILAAYRRVVDLLRVGAFRHIVVLNAWQALPGDERLGLPTDAPGHPLYQALSELDEAGADVLFAASDHHAKHIHGPALHPRVLTVTAMNLDGTPFESSVARAGPDGSGKPDVSNYQGFAGYELFRNQGDYGTSAATALTAGLVAAVRSAPQARATSPSELRRLFRQSAERELGASGRDRVSGPGLANVEDVLNEL